ncbi:F-box protein [Ceratobasidium sp. AG-Ba]|nr:F-box protein [Ceratobasidium sp. AG-Ba]
MHILQLPTDVFIVVLSYVGGKDLLVCKQVCKSFRSLLKSSPELHYRLALAKAGVVDGVTGQPVEERLQLLRRLEQSWYPDMLKPRKQFRVLFSRPFTRTDVNAGFVISGMVPRSAQDYEELQIYRLPSTLPNLKAKSWRHVLDSNIRYYKADPVQDMLALLEIPERRYGQGYTLLRVHLRTFSNNKCHPLASRPVLELGKFDPDLYVGQTGEGCEDFSIHIYLDMLALIVKPIGMASDDTLAHQELLTIWQWTSGQRLAVFVPPPDFVFSDCAFIKRDQLLVVHSRSSFGPSISVLHIERRELYSKFSDAVPDCSVEPVTYEPRGTIFQLPAPPKCKPECVGIRDITITNGSSPYPPRRSNEQDSSTPLFVSDPSPESTIVAFSISVVLQSVRHGTPPIIHHTLLAYISTFIALFSPSQARSVPFGEWSVRGVHWFLGPPGFLHGQRYAHTIFDRRWNTVEIYDFNPSHVPAVVSGWQTLVKPNKKPSFSSISPKMSLFKTKNSFGCSHKYYLDGGKLNSNLRYKKQTMKEEMGGQQSGCALDCERVIILDTERGGYIFGFTSYNIT